MDSFKEAVVSAVAELRGDAGLPPERALGTSKAPQLQGLASRTGVQQRQRVGENAREGAEVPGIVILCFLTSLCHYVNVVLVETSSSPSRLLIAQPG